MSANDKHTDGHLRLRWIQIVVRDLRAFGWPDVTPETILSDEICALAFYRQLRDALREVGEKATPQMTRVINGMLAELVAIHGDGIAR
jgi:hypothetical protein